VIPAKDEYLQAVRALCDAQDILLIVDEVQVGLGRTGKLFAHEYANIQPDIMSLAKALGGGAPIGAFLATDKVAAAFQPGDHGSTFGGNPLVTAAGLATLNIMLAEDLPGHAAAMGQYMVTKFQELQKKHTCIKEIRGRGLLLGLALDREGGPIVAECLAQGVLINCTAQTVLRFTPPLIVSKPDIDKMVTVLDHAITKVTAQ
jgi:acetylornithine/N-succinyldiaminopimelate aminotransferase